MKKPSVAVLERIQGTFLEFLTRENLLPLVPVFLIAHTVQGEGYLDEVKLIKIVNLLCLKCGFQQLFDCSFPRCRQSMA